MNVVFNLRMKADRRLEMKHTILSNMMENVRSLL